MALVHTEATRNGITNYVVDLIDVSGPGTLVFQTTGDAAVATLTFAATAFGASVAGVATAAAIVSDTNAVGGVVSKFRIFNGAALEVLQGNVLTSGGDINLSSLTVGPTDTVSMSALTYTAPV